MARHWAVVGTQWGDEGKGKVVDCLAPRFQVVVRYQGGANAGHTVVVGGEKFALHLIPSGILQKDKVCLIGDGVVVHLETLVEELTQLHGRVQQTARLLLSKKAQLVMPWHLARDGIAGGKIGTTKRGIGPCYSDATARRGIRVSDLLKPERFRKRVREECEWNRLLIAAMCDGLDMSSQDREQLNLDRALDAEEIAESHLRQADQLRQLGVEIVDGSLFLWEGDRQGHRILFEGAQATLLDVIHGDYPFVTSSHPTVGGVSIGTGFRPRRLTVVGVVKAYSTRVGAGPLPTELFDQVGEGIRERGVEFGTTTGRPRRCGWLDLTVVKYAARVNGLDALAITKLDILTGIGEVKVGVGYRVGGKSIQDYPADVGELSQCEPEYTELPGWDEDISSARKFADLPQAAQRYVRFIEEFVGVPVRWVSVGPERQQIIRK
jgi:adenylosuccinate synthase